MKQSSARGKPFSRIHHVGVVVRDIDKAIEYYESLGIGPFKSMTLPGEITEQKLYGKPDKFILKGAVADIGEIEIELIQPVENAPVQEKFLQSRGEGINHLGFKVENVDEEEAELLKKDFNNIQGRRRSSGVVTGYYDTDRVGGVIVELWQPPT